MAAINTVSVDLDMLEFSFIRLAVEIQIQEIKIKILEEGETVSLKQQLDIFQGIQTTLFDAYERELKK